MGSKKPFHDDDGSGVLVPEPKRRLTFKNVVSDVMKGNSHNEFESIMETSIRKLVREEMERVFFTLFQPNSRPSFNQAETSRGRCLQLLFENKLPSLIYTGSRIEAENGKPIKIVLKDPISGTKVTSGPYSSMKIEILVLDGDFGFDDREHWTQREFSAKIVKEREGKRPLVTGNLNITLKDGVGIVSDVIFTDNSSWIRCRKFRLGARVLERNCSEVQIKEARSKAFIVKDHRGELYKKHYPPSLDDDVWRLEKIAKDGIYHTRLADKGVKNVKDFLRMHTVDRESLFNIMDAPKKARETIVEHAKTCVINDEKLYVFPGYGARLLFNSIYKLVAATFDGQNYVTPKDLTLPQALLVEDLKKIAYEKANEFIPIDARTSFGPSVPLPNPQAETFSSPTSILQNPEFPIAHREMQLDFYQASTSTSYKQEATGDNHQFLCCTAQNTHPPPLQNSLTMGEFFLTSGCGDGGNSWSPNSSNLAAEMSQIDNIPTWSPANAIWGQNNNSFSPAPSGVSSEFGVLTSLPNIGVHISRTGKPKAAWCKIRAAVIWVSVRRDLAARKMERSFYVNMNYFGSGI